MTTILSLLKRVERLPIDTVITDSMEEVAPMISDRQKGQMLEGLNAKGMKIGHYRNPAYARLKNSMNPVPGLGVPDLHLTGEFYREIYTEIRGEKVIIDSTNEKTEALAKRFGEEIFGLNKPTKAELIKEDLQPVFMKHIRKELRL